MELKKILVSLIDVAQKLMCLNPAGYKEARSELIYVFLNM
jgi:hypothetical protein